MADEACHELSLGAPIPPETTNRVKVYRLKGNDWEDLGTGLCGGFYDKTEACIHVLPEQRPCGDGEGYHDENQTGEEATHANANSNSSNSQDSSSTSSTDSQSEDKTGGSSSDSGSSGSSSNGTDNGTGTIPVTTTTTTPASNPDRAEQKPARPIGPLLEKRISAIRIQKQGDTFIVMDEDNQVPMTLSFETTEGCDTIWEFLLLVKKSYSPEPTESGNSSPAFVHSVLPVPKLGNLEEVEIIMRSADSTLQGRHDLIDNVISTDYLDKLVPLVDAAEKARSLSDLRHLCNIMKLIIFLNDSVILERVVRDEYIYGVIGALEYDPEFQNSKATHREYLKTHTSFKQVIPFTHDDIPNRIRSAYRLQYLKDVVFARVLDGFSFSVFNTLIFFNQVGILEYLQKDLQYVQDLFAIFTPEERNIERQRDGLRLLQQCCSLAKTQQVSSRAELFATLIGSGLFRVISFAMPNPDLNLRIAATDILLTLVEQEPALVQTRLFQLNNRTSLHLSDVVIDRLVDETDTGIKTQISEILKSLFNPDAALMVPETTPKAKIGIGPRLTFRDVFLQIYARSSQRLFSPLKNLAERDYMKIDGSKAALYIHLVDILCFFVKEHSLRSSYAIVTDEISTSIGKLLKCPSKHVKVAALKFFRTCISVTDVAYTEPLLMPGVLGNILDVVSETMPRNTLLNSACLEIFEHIRRVGVQPLILQLVRRHRKRMEEITYVGTFHAIIAKYDAMMTVPPIRQRPAFSRFQESMQDPTVTRGRPRANSQRGLTGDRARAADLDDLGKDANEDEDGYFRSLEEEEEDDDSAGSSSNRDGGADEMGESSDDPVPRSLMKPLVSYPDDDDDDDDDGDSDRTQPFDSDEGLSASSSQGLSQGESASGSQGESVGGSQGESVGESVSGSLGESLSASQGESASDSQGLSQRPSESDDSQKSDSSGTTTVDDSPTLGMTGGSLKRRLEDDNEDDVSPESPHSKRRTSNGISDLRHYNLREPRLGRQDDIGDELVDEYVDSPPSRSAAEADRKTDGPTGPNRLRRISISISGIRKQKANGATSAGSSPPSDSSSSSDPASE